MIRKMLCFDWSWRHKQHYQCLSWYMTILPSLCANLKLSLVIACLNWRKYTELFELRILTEDLTSTMKRWVMSCSNQLILKPSTCTYELRGFTCGACREEYSNCWICCAMFRCISYRVWVIKTGLFSKQDTTSFSVFRKMLDCFSPWNETTA